jgi:hypothetical protein
MGDATAPDTGGASSGKPRPKGRVAIVGGIGAGALVAQAQSTQAPTSALPFSPKESEITAGMLEEDHMQVGYQFTSKWLNNHGTLCTVEEIVPEHNTMVVRIQTPMNDYLGNPMVSENSDSSWNLEHYHWGIRKGEYVPATTKSAVVAKLVETLGVEKIAAQGGLFIEFLQEVCPAKPVEPEVFVMPKVLPDMLPYDTSLPASIRPGQRFKRPLHEGKFFLYYTVTHVYETTDTVLYKSDSQPQPQAFSLAQLKKLFSEGMFKFVDMVEYVQSLTREVVGQFHAIGLPVPAPVTTSPTDLSPSAKAPTKRQRQLKQLQSNAGMRTGELDTQGGDAGFMDELNKTRA